MCKSNFVSAAAAVVMALNSQAWAAPKEAVAAPVDASIGAITELARQVKVETLKKELRDLKSSGKEAAPANVQAILNSSLPMGTGGRAVKQAATAVASPAVAYGAEAPVVYSVAGMGGKLKATLSDGRSIAQGDKWLMGDFAYTAESVSAQGVVFKRCNTKAATDSCSNVARRVDGR